MSDVRGVAVPRFALALALSFTFVGRAELAGRGRLRVSAQPGGSYHTSASRAVANHWARQARIAISRRPITRSPGTDDLKEIEPKLVINNRVSKGRLGMAGTTAQSQLNAGNFDTPEQCVGEFNRKRKEARPLPAVRHGECDWSLGRPGMSRIGRTAGAERAAVCPSSRRLRASPYIRRRENPRKASGKSEKKMMLRGTSTRTFVIVRRKLA